MKFYKVFITFIGCFPFMLYAQHAWHLEKESTIQFTAIQNNAPITGEFKEMTGEIEFSPNELETSQIKIQVDMNSVALSYNELAQTLKAPEWFNVKMFPKALFNSNKIIKVEGENYQAHGMLTLKDKTFPIVATFVLSSYDKDSAAVKGFFSVKRLLFGVGQGEWASTEDIKDEVKVNFKLKLKK